jgi:hypothetical protein
MPDAAPVTTATLPCNFIVGSLDYIVVFQPTVGGSG